MTRTGPPAHSFDDQLWSAVGDPTRRQLLDLLLNTGGGTATALSEELPVTRQAVAKHLAVLDRVGLVHGVTSGRERRFQVDEDQLARAAAQLASVGSEWDGRLRRIARIAERIEADKRATEPRSANRTPDDRTPDDRTPTEPEASDRPPRSTT